MTKETYWALKQREWAAREQRPRRRSRSLPLRRPTPPVARPIPAETLEETTVDFTVGPEGFDSDEYQLVDNDLPAEEPSYRDLQAQAKELDIKANQPADKLKKAIEEAG